jgi:hypothetical protein
MTRFIVGFCVLCLLVYPQFLFAQSLQRLELSNPNVVRQCFIGDPVGTLLDPLLILSNSPSTTAATLSTHVEFFIDTLSNSGPTSNYEELFCDTSALPEGASQSFILNTAVSPNMKMLRLTFPPNTPYSSIQSALRTVRFRVKSGHISGTRNVFILVQDPNSPIKFAKQTVLPDGSPASFTRARGLRFFRLVKGSVNWSTASSNIVASRNYSYFGLTNGYFASTYTADEFSAITASQASSNVAGTGLYFLGGSDRVVEGEWRWGDDPDEYTALHQFTNNSRGSFPPFYHNFLSPQPDNSSNEDFLQVAAGIWNDLADSVQSGYFVMYRLQDCTQKLTIQINAQNSLLHMRPL